MLRRLFREAGAFLCLCGAVVAGSGFGAPVSVISLDVPFIKQEKNGCGAASVAMVMQYWHHQTGESEDESSDPVHIQRVLYSSKARGIYASDIETYLQKHHFRAYAFRGEWADLKENLSKGRPLIVGLKPRSGESTLHFVVVAGVDWEQNVILVNDAAQRKLLKVDRASFMKEWNAVDGWTLLAVPQPRE